MQLSKRETKKEAGNILQLASAIYPPMSAPGYTPAWKNAPIGDFNLVLEGGSMRGLFTAGVLDLFMDEKVFPHTVIGVSAGALNGCSYVAGMKGRTLYLNCKYCNDWRYFSLRSFLLKGSVTDTDFVYRRLLYELEPFDFDSFANSPIKLVTEVINLESGEAEFFEHADLKDDIDILRASASLPLITRTVTYKNKKYLDGGMSDSVPIRYSQSLGAKKHIVILTQHDGFIKKPSRLLRFSSPFYAKYPRFVCTMNNRHNTYNQVYKDVAEMHKRGEIYLLRPQEPITIKSMEKDSTKLFDLYLKGYEEAKNRLPEIHAYLAR